MKKILIIIIILVLVFFGLTFFFGENGLIGSLLAMVGLGGYVTDKEFKKKAEELDKKADEINKEVKKLEDKKKKLKEDGVKDLTPEEEKDYWKEEE